MSKKVFAICLLSFFFCSLQKAHGQKINNIWTFGRHLGLDFTSGSPVFYVDSINTEEGCAAVCDNSGNLLFYSDGLYVYDRTHTVMPNGNGILGHYRRSATQAVAIVPIIQVDTFFYLFTVDEYGSSGTLRYSKIDMRLHGGLGDVDTLYKNILIDSGRSEKMTIAKSCTDLWVITHDADSPVFYSQKVNTLTGSLSSPLRSETGVYRKVNTFALGEIKVSPDQSHIALANYTISGTLSTIELYDFDSTSGVVSNYRLIDSAYAGYAYGLEYSPDGTKLYAGTATSGAAGLFQYNLSAGSPVFIKASKTLIDTGTAWGMRLGPDSMIYVSFNFIPTNFSRIKKPNLSGSLCDFQRDFLPTSTGNLSRCFGFGNQVLPIPSSINTVTKHSNYEICEEWRQKVTLSDRTDLVWYDGDTSISKTFYAPGTYWARSVKNCILYIDSVHLVQKPNDTLVLGTFDTTTCRYETVSFRLPSGYDTCKWYDGDTALSKSLDTAGVIWLYARKDCTIYIDSFRLYESPSVYIGSSNDTGLCVAGKGTTIYGRPGANEYKNSIGARDSALTIRSVGVYWVASRYGCVVWVDTLHVHSFPITKVYSSNVFWLCETTSDTLSGIDSADTYHWNVGDTTRSVLISDTGIYWVESFKNCIHYTDTFHVRQIRLTKWSSRHVDSLCAGDSLSLSGHLATGPYSWSTGDTSLSIRVFDTGTYWVTSLKDCIRYSDTINVHYRVLQYKNRSHKDSLCLSDTIVLKGMSGMSNYRWNTGSTSINISIIGGGTYWVSSLKDCTLYTDSFFVNALPLLLDVVDTALSYCEGMGLVLSARYSTFPYLWSTGENTRTISVGAPGTYWVRSVNECKHTIDTFHVFSIPNRYSRYQSESLVCFLDSIMLYAPAGFDSCTWSGGNRGKDTCLYRDDSVWVTAYNRNACEIVEHGYQIQFAKFEHTLQDTFLCNGQSIILNAALNKPGAKFYWSSGQATDQIQVSKPGTYILTVEYESCTLLDTIRVGEKQLNVFLGADTTLCYGENLSLSSDVIDSASYLWNTGDTSRILTISKSGYYSLQISKDGCSVSDTKGVKYEQCTECLAIPNSFSPNGDQINDRFRPIVSCQVFSYSFKIFSRWGQELFSTESLNQSWDGKLLGRELDLGVYFYLIRIKYEAFESSEFMFKGDVSLIR